MRDQRVRETLVPHPQTVTDTSVKILDDPQAAGYYAAMRRPTRAPKYDAQTESKRFHPRVWALALEAAGGDPYRLIAYSLTHVEVLNRPRPRGTSVWAPGAQPGAA